MTTSADPALDHQQRVQRALDLAYRHLGRRDRSTFEMRRYLEGKRTEPGAIEDVLAELTEQGYLDDTRYARRFAEDRRELDGWGADRIEGRLRQAGISGEHIEAALSGRDRGGELDAARALVARRFRAPLADDRERARAHALLVRKGYDSDLAYDVVRNF